MDRRLGVMLSAFVLVAAASSAAPTGQAWTAMPGCDPTAAQEVERAFPCQRGPIESIFLHLANGMVEVVEVEMIDGYAVFQGDILLELDEDGHAHFGAGLDAAARLDAKGAGRAAAAFLWQNRTVPFVIDGNLNNTMRGRVEDAIDHWEARTNLNFVARNGQADFVRFIGWTGGCAANAVGRNGGEQLILLSGGCSTGNVIHEIGHAIGLWHEHTRADRNNTLIINWANIANGRANNFQTYVALGENGADYGNLDFGSIMMYDSFAFSWNGQPTITRLNGTTFTSQRNALSAGDEDAVNCDMYTNPLNSAWLSCWGNSQGSLQVTCQANTNGGTPPFSYSWTYGGTADQWHPFGSRAFAYYNSPGCNSYDVNFFTVTVTDACGETAWASMGSLPCWSSW